MPFLSQYSTWREIPLCIFAVWLSGMSYADTFSFRFTSLSTETPYVPSNRVLLHPLRVTLSLASAYCTITIHTCHMDVLYRLSDIAVTIAASDPTSTPTSASTAIPIDNTQPLPVDDEQLHYILHEADETKLVQYLKEEIEDDQHFLYTQYPFVDITPFIAPSSLPPNRRASVVLYNATLLHIISATDKAKTGEMLISLLSSDMINNDHATISGLIALSHVAPLHVSVLYGRGALVSALLSRGGDARVQAQPSNVTALILSADRGLTQSFQTLLPLTIPEAYFHPAPPLSPDEQAALDEWQGREDAMRAEEAAGKKYYNERGEEVDLEWYRQFRTFDRPVAAYTRMKQDIHTMLFTALSYAVAHGHDEIVKILLEPKYEVDVNARSWQGRGDTLLHGATIKGHIEVVKLLLEHGADPMMKTYDEMTIEEICDRYHRDEIGRLIATWKVEHGITSCKEAEPELHDDL